MLVNGYQAGNKGLLTVNVMSENRLFMEFMKMKRGGELYGEN